MIRALSRLWLATLLSIMPALAASADVFQSRDQDARQQRVDALDANIEQVARERGQIRDQINEANRFFRDAKGWFDRYAQVQQEIQKVEAEKASGGYSIVDNRQLDDRLAALVAQRRRIETLNGGTVIGGTRYGSLRELQDATQPRSNDLVELNEQYTSLAADLTRLDARRDELTSQLDLDDRHRLVLHKRQLSVRERELAACEQLVADENLVILADNAPYKSAPPFMSRDSLFFHVTDQYLFEINTSQDRAGTWGSGVEFDPDELASRLKRYLGYSNAQRQVLRTEVLPRLETEIASLRTAIASIEQGGDVRGCWTVLLGTSNFPRLEISRNQSEGYDGIITDRGRLAHIRAGHRLFIVTRTNSRTFDGSEFAFDEAGRPTRSQLRLVLDADGVSMSYRTDQLLALRRCD